MLHDDAEACMIAEALVPLATPLDRLTLLPGNPRRGDVAAVARSLKAFGQRKPITAKADGTITAGNHTYLAAQSLGWTEVAVVFLDDDEATAMAWSLADNHTAELGGYDNEGLIEYIRQVQESDAELLAATGWSDEDLALLQSAIDPHFDPDDTEQPRLDQRQESACPSCGFTWRVGPNGSIEPT